MELPGVLSDTKIKQRLREDLIIHPFLHEESAITGCKVDLHLSGAFYEIQRSTVDSYDPLKLRATDFRREIILPLGGSLVLHPGDLILAPTFENISMPRDLLGILQGRSSLGRLGVIVHATASFIDPKFSGSITLELSNLGHLPVRLYTLARVASIAFLEITGKVQYGYGDAVPDPLRAGAMRQDHYASPKSEASRHHEDWEYKVIRKATQDGPVFPGTANRG
jgi:dCTP deaminase